MRQFTHKISVTIIIIISLFIGLVIANDTYIDNQTVGKYWIKVKENTSYQYTPWAKKHWYDNGWQSEIVKADSVGIGDGASVYQNSGWMYNVSWAAPEPNETRIDHFLAKFYYTANDYKTARDNVTVTWNEEEEGNE